MIIDYVDNRPVPRYLIYDIIKYDVSWRHVLSCQTGQNIIAFLCGVKKLIFCQLGVRKGIQSGND